MASGMPNGNIETLLAQEIERNANNEARIQALEESLESLKRSIVSAGMRDNRKQVFCLKTGSFSTTSQAWTDFTGCSGEVTFLTSTIAFSLSISGHYVDGKGSANNFRLRLNPVRTNDSTPVAHYFVPDAEGVRKYIYTEWCRHEEVTIQDVVKVPLGTHRVQLEVKVVGDGGATTYNWHPSFGQVSLVMW